MADAVAHVRTTFQFALSAPPEIAAPFFGPEGERCWAGEDWDPRFLHPQPAQDVEGAVFTIQRGGETSVWVNTLFDLADGRMQYVAFTPNVMVSTIEVRLTPLARNATSVEVIYTRTAISPSTNGYVHEKARSDAQSGPIWKAAIERAIQTACTRPT